MQITIVAVGKRMPQWIAQGVEEYLKRLPRELSVKLIEVAPGKRHKRSVREDILNKEAQRIKAAQPAGALSIALDETGKQHNSKMLAQKLEAWTQAGQDITFIIGGADGLDPALINQSTETWSLSNYTMPHALVRVFLVEQLYRAWTILTKHPYHRE